jgi:hypothetical protein
MMWCGMTKLSSYRHPCAGTAVRLENVEILGSGKIEKLRELHYAHNKLKEIERFRKMVPYY